MTDHPDLTGVHRRRWWTLAVLCLSLLVIGIDNTILNVALPTLVEDLGATASQQQWMVDTYVLVFASLLLTAGMLADRYGRRGALQLGLAVFALGSMSAAFAGSAGTLIAARAVMGVGGAMIMPSTLSILTNVFTDARERARAIGVWAGVAGLGIAIGPITGGWLLEHFWWGSVFLVNLPVVAVALAAGWHLVPTSRDPSPRRLDPAGTVLSFAGLAGVLYGIIEAPTQGWTDSTVMAAFGAGVVVLAAFVAWERHVDHPMLDMRFFRNPRFSGASVAIMLVFFALFGSIFFLTQYLQFVLGYGTLHAGLAVAPIALALMIAAPLAPVLTARVGTKVMVATGLAVVAGGLAILSTVSVNSGYGHVLTSIMVLGVGMGLAMAPATDSIMGSLPKERAGVGSAVNDTTRMVGGSLGVAVLGSLLSAGYHSAIGSSAAIAKLPGSAAAAARDSLGGAVEVASRVGGAGGQSLLADASRAFVHAMGHAVLAGAGVALVGALVALVWLPAQARAGTDAEPGPTPADGARRAIPPVGERLPARGLPARADGAMTTPIVEAHGLTKRFGKVDALAGLDLVAESGQVVAVLGPNGAGKTTFVRTIATLVRPDAGSLRVAGLDVVRHPDHVRRIIGLAGQYAAVEQAMTGRENLVMVARLFGHDGPAARANADAVLAQMGLSDAADRLVRTYSGGMRRRLDLGASLVGAPRLLLLDEPTSGLDPRSRIELWDAIRSLVAHGTDVLLTTQYLDEADQLASQVAIVDHGRVIAEGTPGDLKMRAGRDVVEVHAHQTDDLGRLADVLAAIGTEAPRLDPATRRVTVPVTAGRRAVTDAVRALDMLDVDVDDIGLRRPTLDEVFLSLTGGPINTSPNGSDHDRPREGAITP